MRIKGALRAKILLASSPTQKKTTRRPEPPPTEGPPAQPLWFSLKGPVPVKKNSMEVFHKQGHLAIRPNEKYRTWEKATVRKLWASKLNLHQDSGRIFPIGYSAKVAILIYVRDRRRKDLLNLMAGPMDALVKAGILVDDCWEWVRSHDGSQVVLDPGVAEHFEVFIEPWRP